MRVMVANVDDYWRLATDIGARIIIPIADRYYGLRDFTIADPDGFGIRFASLLPSFKGDSHVTDDRRQIATNQFAERK